MKKIFTFCVSLLAALSVFAYDFQSGDLFYNITSSSAPYTVEVTQQTQYTTGNYSGITTLTIPETVMHDSIIYTVTSIGDEAFHHCSNLTTITILNTVTSIGEYAFAYCKQLASVSIGSGVKTIYMAAFNNCSALTTITIPANVKEIYNQAFTGASISTIYMKGTTPPSLLKNKSDGSAFQIFTTTPTCYVPCSAVDSYKASTKWKGAVREFVAEFPYAFTVIPSDASMGTISITQQPDCSTPAIFEAISNTGCFFLQWSDGNTDNPRTLNVTQDTRLTAYFARSTYIVNLIAGANGAVSGAGTYNYGATATITAIPNDGYHFTQWSDGNTDNPRSIVVVEPISLTALFEENYTQEYCQIIYNSTHGNIVNPNTPSGAMTAFGVNIVSNTYTDGQGIITFDGPIKTIGDTAFYNCSDLTSIIIPDRVTTIGNQAFQNCNALSNVTFGNRVESIGKAAFNNCSALQTLTIPQSVQYIYNYAFLGTSISTVYINSTTPPILNPDHEDPYLVFTTNAITTCHIPCGTLASYQASDWNTKSFVRSFVEDCETSIDPTWQILYTSTDGNIAHANPEAFNVNMVSNEYKNGLGVITFDGPITQIDSYAFYGSTVDSIILPNTITSIGHCAFYLSSLSSITIPESVQTIKSSAFSCCYSLKTLIIEEGVTAIENEAFYHCSSLTSINLPNSIISIGDLAFNDCNSLAFVYIGNNLKHLGENVFESNPSLTSITWNAISGPDSQWRFEPFSDVPVSSFTFGNDVVRIPDLLCSGLCEVTSIIIPNSVDSIGYGAFERCYSLTSITIPNSVTNIGDNAFYACSSITSITIPENVAFIGANAFLECTSLESIIWNAIRCDGAPFYDLRSQVKSFTLGNAVEHIPGYLCYSMSSLCEISIPESVRSIGEQAFAWCTSLTSIEIPANIQNIGEKAFSSNSPIDTIYIRATTPPTLGTEVFFDGYYTPPLSICYIPCGTLADYQSSDWVNQVSEFIEEGCEEPIDPTWQILYTSTDGNIVTPYATDVFGANIVSNTYENGVGTITFDGPVTCIGERALISCSNLMSVAIPNSVTSIGGVAFYNCSSLTSVTIPNSVTNIGEKAFCGCDSITKNNFIGDVASWCDIKFADATANPMYYSHDFCINNQEIHDLVIPNTVDSIHNYAFYDASSLTSITIPNSVTNIGESAFAGCSSITSITIPNSVTSIGSSAFVTNSSLLKTNYTGDVASWCDIKFGNASANPMCCSHNFYINEQEIKDLIIPNTVNSIHDYAFYNCSSLTSITIPNSVTNIGERAFYNCSSLTSITIPNSVTNIGERAFSNCSGLTSIVVENGNAVYDNRDNCNAIIETPTNTLIAGCQNTIIPNSVTSIGSGAFSGCSSLTSITIPNSVTSIGDYAFSDCSSLTSITIPNSVMSIGSGAFSSCSSLTSITIPNSVTNIGSSAFSSCSSLTSITIPNSVTSIGMMAFQFCSSLTSVTIGNGVASIGICTFHYCPSLDTICVRAMTPPTLGMLALQSNPLTAPGNTPSLVCVIPCGTLAAYEASDWEKYVSEFVEEGCEEPIDPTWQITYTSTDGNIVTPYKTDVFGANIVSNEYQDGQGVITFDGPVTSIGDSAFWECAELASIAIPESVTTIGYRAFSHCNNLASVTIPSGVTNIEEAVLAGCPALSRIIVENGNPIYDSRDNCNAIVETATNTLIAGCKNTIIPNTITTIGESAFWYCSTLTSITIPSSVKTIGVRAFVFCPSLTSIKIPKSVTKIEHPILTGCNSATSIVVEEANPNYDSRDNCNAIIETATNALLIGCQNTIIPNSVSHIREYAFAYSTYPSIVSKATTPPYVDGNAFLLRETPITVYIPCGTKSAYEASDWAQYVSEFVEEGCAPIQKCGDDLYWEYADGVLTITGTGDMYDYAKDTGVPWYDVRGDIKTVSLPDVMTKIGQNAFYKCTAMTSINMPTSLTAIGEKAFAQDTKLACEIILPVSMTTIASRAFFNCKAVPAFHVEATTPPTVQADAFDYTTAPIHVPCGYGHIYGKHTQWGMLNLEMCELLQDNVYYYPIDGHTARAVTYHSNPTDTIVIPSAVVIDGMPRTVTEVADFAFTDCKDIPAIIFNEGLEYIGERAFVRCYGLQGTIVLPATLETIGERAFSYCDNVEKYLIQAMTPPALGDGAFTCANHDALFYVSCEVMDDYKVAARWSSLKSRLRDACLNIYHYNTPLGTNGVYTTEDTLVASIYYRRQFTPYRWETLYLPFEVDRVTVLEDGVEYDLTAWDIVYGGHYFLAKPDGWLNMEIIFGFTDELDAHTPYIIQFKDDYYRDKIITFYGKESWNKLSTSFEVLSSSSWMQIAGNTTLQDQLLEKPVYMLRSGLDFILQKTTTTLHPFECYVMPYATPSGTPARMNVRFRGDVPTAVESVKGNESHLTYTVDGYTLTVYPQGQAFSIYSLNGALIYSCEAGKEAVDCELNSGCYLLHAGAEAHKIML